MKDQSHKEEMSKALRGDFERLRERGVAATLAPRDDPPPNPSAVEAPPDMEAATQIPGSPVEEAGTPAPSGWLGRLFGR